MTLISIKITWSTIKNNETRIKTNTHTSKTTRTRLGFTHFVS